MIEEKVKKFVLKRMLKNKSFTSKEITKKMRDKNPNIFVKNSDVSLILRSNVLQWSYAEGLQYNANLIYVISDGQNVKTYEYSPEEI